MCPVFAPVAISGVTPLQYLPRESGTGLLTVSPKPLALSALHPVQSTGPDTHANTRVTKENMWRTCMFLK